MWTDVGHINLIGGLVTRNPPKNYEAVKFINWRIAVDGNSTIM